MTNLTNEQRREELFTTYELVTPPKNIARRLSDERNRQDYQHKFDNYFDVDGTIYMSGGYGEPEVREHHDNLVWIIELEPGTKPEDFKYSSSHLVTTDQFKSKYCP